MTSAESSLSTAQTNLNDASLTSTHLRHGRLGEPDRGPAGHRFGFGLGWYRYRQRHGNRKHRKHRESRVDQQLRGELEQLQLLVERVGSDRRHRYRLLHRQHHRRRHPDRADQRRGPGRHHGGLEQRDVRRPGIGCGVDTRIELGSGRVRFVGHRLRDGGLDQPDRQPELERDHVPGRDPRDRETPRAFTPAPALGVSIIVKQLNDVTEVPTNAISYTRERAGHRHQGGQRKPCGHRRDGRGRRERRDTDHRAASRRATRCSNVRSPSRRPVAVRAASLGGTGSRSGGFPGGGGVLPADGGRSRAGGSAGVPAVHHASHWGLPRPPTSRTP